MTNGSVIHLKVVNEVLNAKGIENLSVDFKELKKAAQAADKQIQSMRFSEVMMSCGAFSTSVQNLMSVFDSATQDFKSFDAGMLAANTMAGKTGAEFDDLKNKVSELAKEIPKVRDALADGLYQVISNGVPEDNWIDFLKDSSKAAVGGMADLGGVVTVTSTILKNYGLEWSQAGAIQDKIQTTAKNGVTSFEQLQQALPRVSGNAATLGVSIDELMGAFATLTGVSGNTAEVSTQLAAIFTSLIKPSSQAAKMAEEMGIQFNAAAIQSAGGFQNFLTTLDSTVKSYAASTGMLEQEIYGKLFGSAEALRALGPLTGKLADKYQENVEAMAASTGAIEEAAAQMSQTTEAKLQLAKNAWAGFTDVVAKAIVAVQPFVNIMGSVGQAVSGITAMTAAMRKFITAASGLKAVQTLLGGLRSGFMSIPIASTAAQTRALASALGISAKAATTLGIAIKGAIISTGIGIAITAITTAVEYYTRKTAEAAEKTDRLAREIKELQDSIQNAYLDTAAQAQSEMDEQIRRLDALIKGHKDTGEAVKELNDRYGKIFGTYKTASEWYDVLIRKSKEYAKALGYEALQREAGQQAAKLDMELDDLYAQKKAIDKRRNRLKYEKKYYGEYGGRTGAANTLEASARALDEQIADKEQKLTAVNAEIDKAQSKIDGIYSSIKAKTPSAAPTGGNEGTGGKGAKSKAAKEDPVLAEVLTRDMASLEDYEKALNDLNTIRKKASQDMLLEIDGQIAELKKERDLWEAIGTLKRVPVKTAEKGTLPDVKWEVPVKPVLDRTVQQNIAKETQKILQSVPSAFEWTKTAWGNVQGLTRGMESLNDVLKEDASAWDRINSAINGVLMIYEAVINIMKMFEAAQAAAQAAKQADTMITNQNTTANVANAASKAFSAHSWIPWVGVALGAASVAMMVATMAGLPKFADGGVISGPTVGLMGEYAGAKSNPEVVAPLSKLRDMLDTGSAGPQEVKFRIENETLVGVLDKYYRKRSRT